jgi:DNA-binding transcriptional LysR family regulator
MGGLVTFPFRLDRLVLVVPRAHALARRRRIEFREAAGHDFVGLAQGSALQEHLCRHALALGSPLKLRVRVGGFEAVCQAVERGAGLGIVPETAARRFGRRRAVRAVRLADPWALRRLTLCVRSLEALPLHARRLAEHLRADGWR